MESDKDIKTIIDTTIYKKLSEGKCKKDGGFSSNERIWIWKFDEMSCE